jgi:hypothetical protein
MSLTWSTAHSTTDSCWPDKICFDEARVPTQFFEELGVFHTIMKLHEHDVKTPSCKDCGRRLCLVFVAEIPSDDTLFDMATMIADHINENPDTDEKQTINPPDRNNFVMARDQPFVAVLGNRQTKSLAEEILAPGNLHQFFDNQPEVIPAF